MTDIPAIGGTGERTFSFYRDPSADVNLAWEDVPQAMLHSTKILHFGSVSLTSEPAQAASITTSRHGAIPAMPTLEEVEQ